MRSGGLYGIYFIIIILCPGQRQLAREVHNNQPGKVIYNVPTFVHLCISRMARNMIINHWSGTLVQ